MRGAWDADGLSVRSTEYSSVSSLEDFTCTQQADDPPAVDSGLLPSQDMGIGQVVSWHGEVSFGGFVGQK